MEEKIKSIVLKYFNEAEIDSVKFKDGKAIVTIKDAKDDDVKSKALQTEIEVLKGVKKVFIVYTSTKKTESLNPREEKWVVNGVKKIIMVASGKGGVGKSTTAVNLALALANKRQKVALFDADIYGPSLPKMLGYENVPPITFDGLKFEPFSNLHIQSMSIGSLLDPSQPLVWRGIKAVSAIEQLLTGSTWKDVDIMVIDMPPGTGDIQLSLSQKLDIKGAVIVSTPQDIALIDAIKAVNMFKMVNVPVLGIIENMSYYICEHCGTRADIFGHEGAKAVATSMGERFLGEIPLHISIRENADHGTPIVSSQPDNDHTKAYEDIAEELLELI